MENQPNKMYNGNLFWVLEALKIVNKEINFDLPLNLNKSSTEEAIVFYDTIVFNEDKEDSLFVQINVN